MHRSQFVAYLIRKNCLPTMHQQAALTLPTEEDLCCHAVLHDWIDAETLAKTLAGDFGLRLVTLRTSLSELEKTQAAFITKHKAVPFQEKGKLYLALADPNNTAAINAFKHLTQTDIEPCLAPANQIQQKYALLSSQALQETLEPESFINTLIQQAVSEKASDIHFESLSTELRIRFRIDGLLRLSKRICNTQKSKILNRLKILANLDISEQRLPQDGQVCFPNHLNCRISSCPTVYGEKIVLRLLTQYKMPDIAALGFSKTQEKQFIEAIEKPQGLILVTGPTGSGKTITLYSALAHLNTLQKNICTVEDPVEIPLTGVNQINIQPKIGLDFASCLKTLLRQDPDILMVGEIRDSESAKMAIRAAQTGHLVLATLHANSAQETITRLKYLGLTPDLIAYALNLIIAQRLARKLCQHCFGKHCEKCEDGYNGRLALFELLPFDEQLRADCLQEKAIQPEVSLQAFAETLLQKKLTDANEIKRVIQR